MTRLLFSLVLFTAMIVVYSGCQPAPEQQEVSIRTSTPFHLDSMRSVIQEKTNAFTQAHITGDTAYLNNIFTVDAHGYPPGGDVVSGRAAIAAINAEWVNYQIKTFTETSQVFYGDENYLIDEGIYSLTYGDENILDSGKYINIWKPENGEWKICSNIWNAGPESASE